MNVMPSALVFPDRKVTSSCSPDANPTRWLGRVRTLNLKILAGLARDRVVVKKFLIVFLAYLLWGRAKQINKIPRKSLDIPKTCLLMCFIARFFSLPKPCFPL